MLSFVGLSFVVSFSFAFAALVSFPCAVGGIQWVNFCCMVGSHVAAKGPKADAFSGLAALCSSRAAGTDPGPSHLLESPRQLQVQLCKE